MGFACPGYNHRMPADPAVSTDFRFASAISSEDHIEEAIDEAVGEAFDAMAGPVDLAIVLATEHHRMSFATIAEKLQESAQPRVALGATAAGVLASGAELEQRPGLAVLLGRMPGVSLRSFDYDRLDFKTVRDHPAAMRHALLGEAASEPPDDLAAMLMFADPFSVPLVNFIPSINAAIPGVPIVGGVASGARAGGDNRLILDGKVARQGAVGVLLSGPVRVDCTVSQGCRPVGEPFVVTRAKHNIIQELGGHPALQAIQKAAADLPTADRTLMTNGLFIGRVINEYKDHFGRGDFLVRNIIGADESHGYIAVSDRVRVGQTIQLHVRDRNTAMEDLGLLLEAQKLHGPASGALVCTCNGRGKNLFEADNVESGIIENALGPTPMAGFFAAGEIGPVGDENFLHGFTSSMAVFRPKVESTDEHG